MSYIVDGPTALKSTVGESPFMALRSPVIGSTMTDPDNRSRVWRVVDMVLKEKFWEDARSPFNGVLLLCMDGHHYTAFLEQDEAEVLLNMASPGDQVPWVTHQHGQYVGPTSARWVGFHVNQWGGDCDLYMRESLLRFQGDRQGKDVVIPDGTTITRKIHERDGKDWDESWSCIGDVNERNQGPCTDFELLSRRWRMVARTAKHPY